MISSTFSDNMCSKSEETDDLAIHVQECQKSLVTVRTHAGDKRHFPGNSNRSIFEEETPTRDARIEKENSDREDNSTQRNHFPETEEIHVEESKIISATDSSAGLETGDEDSLQRSDRRHFSGNTPSSIFEEETPSRDARIEKENKNREDYSTQRNNFPEIEEIHVEECKISATESSAGLKTGDGDSQIRSDRRHFSGNTSSSVFEEESPSRAARIEKENIDHEDYSTISQRNQFSEVEDLANHVQECKINSATENPSAGLKTGYGDSPQRSDRGHFPGKTSSSIFEEETPSRDARIKKENSDHVNFEKTLD